MQPTAKKGGPATKPHAERRTYRVLLNDRASSDILEPGVTDYIISESIAHVTVITARLFERRFATHLRSYEVPIGQWPFLLFLWADENLSQRDLSRLMAVEESTVTSTISRMERDGLVERLRSSDRRRNKLRLTERGRNLKDDLLHEGRSLVDIR